MSDTVENKVKKQTYKDKYNELKTEYDTLFDSYQRNRADFENYRRNKEKEIEKIRATASERVIMRVMSLEDNFERAISYNKDNQDLFILKKELDEILYDSGAYFYGEIGDKFSYEKYHAVSSIKKEGFEPGYVVDVIKKGCILNGNIIGYCQVVVSE